mgnify:CR=1 FL=1
MPTSIIYSSTDDGYGDLRDSTNWANARGNSDSAADFYDKINTTNYDWAIWNIHNRGNYTCRRSFFSFDLSSLSIGIVTAATLNVWSKDFSISGFNRVIAVGVNAALENSDDDFGKIFTDTTGSTTLEDTYSSPVPFNNTSYAYEEMALNPNALTVINSKVGSGDFQLALIGDYYDGSATNTVPSGGGDYTQIGIGFSDSNIGTGADPKLTLTYTEALTNNAVFFGMNF